MPARRSPAPRDTIIRVISGWIETMRPTRVGRLTVRPRSSRTVIPAWGDPVDSVDSVVKDNLVDSAVKDGLVVADVADHAEIQDEAARVKMMAMFRELCMLMSAPL